MQKSNVRTSKPRLPPVRVINTINRIRTGFSKIQKNMVPPPIAMLEMISGQWISRTIGVCAQFGVADHINDKPTSSDAIAKKVEANPEALYRVMRALTVVGIFTEHEGKKFSLTSVGKTLRTDHPQSMRHMAIFQTSFNWAHWGALDYCVKTGKNAVEHIRGMKPFDYLSKNKEEAEVFDKAMTNISEMEVDSILAVYDFSKFSTIADIGGGYGAFLASVLNTHPKARGILYDMPHVVKGSKEYFANAGLTDRVEIKSGSFFEAVPSGADAYMMKHIIHDWSDEESITILKHIRKQIPQNGKLLLIETVIPERNVPNFSKFIDLEMLVVTTGKERTLADYGSLFAKAGFRLNRAVPSISMANVIEASPI
ncbi:MAG: methyltransferase [Bdellovibrionia bacterium]